MRLRRGGHRSEGGGCLAAEGGRGRGYEVEVEVEVEEQEEKEEKSENKMSGER